MLEILNAGPYYLLFREFKLHCYFPTALRGQLWRWRLTEWSSPLKWEPIARMEEECASIWVSSPTGTICADLRSFFICTSDHRKCLLRSHQLLSAGCRWKLDVNLLDRGLWDILIDHDYSLLRWVFLMYRLYLWNKALQTAAGTSSRGNGKWLRVKWTVPSAYWWTAKLNPQYIRLRVPRGSEWNSGGEPSRPKGLSMIMEGVIIIK